MPFPAQTFATIQQLFNYINTFIVPNGVAEINGTEHNNVENALASFIVKYTLNSGLVAIVTAGGAVSLSSPITVLKGAPDTVAWPDNIQNEYYVVNATGRDIPILSGLGYVDANQVVQTVFPTLQVVHMAKAANGQWIQINNFAVTVSISSVVSSAATLPLSLLTRTYVYNGTVPATWTMPPTAGALNKDFLVKNRGTGILTLLCPGSDNFFDAHATQSLILAPGDAYEINCDGTYWNVF